jgi:hypothetical protein
LGLGSGGLADFANLGSGGLPSFTGEGDVSLALNQLGQLTDLNGVTTNLTASLDNIAATGIDSISLEQLSTAGVLGATSDIATLEAALSASNSNLVGLPNALSLEISDAQANALADLNAFSFNGADSTDVILDSAGATQLSTSLKDLQKLNIDGIGIDGDLTLGLGSGEGRWFRYPCAPNQRVARTQGKERRRGVARPRGATANGQAARPTGTPLAAPAVAPLGDYGPGE